VATDYEGRVPVNGVSSREGRREVRRLEEAFNAGGIAEG
jgi:hypothetical protein